MKKAIKLKMNKSSLTGLLFLLFPVILSLGGCKKFLEAKPDQSIATPSSISDLQGILNNYAFMNARYPSASEVSADDYYLTTADFNTLSDAQRAYYTWQKYDLIGGDYTSPYSSVEYANVVLDALPKIPGIPGDKNAIMGEALYIRAAYHFALAQLFCKPYSNNTAANDPGIVLRTTSDAAVRPVRATIAATYAQIISDLKAASLKLNNQVIQKYLPSKPAALGLLARVYLSMSDYSNAGLYADSALSNYSKLIDYNTISPGATIPFKQFNDEVIYDARTPAPGTLTASKAKVDTVLYASYAANDLRKTVFFKNGNNGSKAFKGNYTGQNNASLFTGIATDELYLIRAECAARAGHLNAATNDLNTLLVNRWKKGSYNPLSFTDQSQLLAAVLKERRKELLFRGLRWIDLRRFNLNDPAKITLTRNVNNTTFLLAPNSDRYVFQLDRNAVTISGLPQNP